MILSYHPFYVADKNRLCAGRDPDATDEALMKQAKAIVLPQGCRRSLYEMAIRCCPNVFPNNRARFAYPGKMGQIRLFRETGMPHPGSKLFANVSEFYRKVPDPERKLPFPFPFVFKFDWGDEGRTVFRVSDVQDLTQLLQKAKNYEQTGQKGFLFQEYIPHQHRVLRVVVMGRRIISYWRVGKTDGFVTNMAHGAEIDYDSDPDLQSLARDQVKTFCSKTGINLAGMDVLFQRQADRQLPLFLEINYFFGRRGLGGSDHYYQMLISEIDRWIRELP